ncbi:MAG: hypothetical protein WC010_03470 [Candidatus Absconditabacterales bacterium]
MNGKKIEYTLDNIPIATTRSTSVKTRNINYFDERGMMNNE